MLADLLQSNNKRNVLIDNCQIYFFLSLFSNIHNRKDTCGSHIVIMVNCKILWKKMITQFFDFGMHNLTK